LAWLPVPVESNVFDTEHLERAKEQTSMLSEFIEAIQKPETTAGMSMTERVQKWIVANTVKPELLKLLTEICELNKDT
jgi:hypothetical protein